MELEQVLGVVAHQHADLLPALEAQVAQLQEGLVLGVAHLADHCVDLALEVHQAVDLVIDLFLEGHNLEDHIFQAMHIACPTGRYIAERGGGFGG